MVALRTTLSRSMGLTLIEVLVALAIVSIAMTAIIKAVSDNIRSTAYLQNKTIALYVGQQIINEARLGLLKLPGEADMLQEKTTMLGVDWYWHAHESATSNARIKKFSVDVYSHEPNEAEPPVVALDGYVYEKE